MEIKNFEISPDTKTVKVFVNPKLFPLTVVQSAAYTFIDRAYVLIGGDPDTEIIVEFTPKTSKENLELLAREFNNELINFAIYEIQSRRTLRMRELLLQRATQTVSQQPQTQIRAPPAERRRE